MISRFRPCLFLLWVIFSLGIPAHAQEIRIGVLSHRGDTATAINWGATADYLSQRLPGYDFVILPLDFDEIEPRVMDASIDFILVNPSIYVTMEVRYRITRIATLSRVIRDGYENQFAGVLFTRAERTDLTGLHDLAGKHLLAVDRKSLGGFQMAIRELADVGVDPESDLRISFGGIHDNVVLAVLAGEADAGTVRTGILESMHQSGEIDIANVRIINPLRDDGFGQLHSTRLYPEWPFSKLPHTPDDLAQNVAIALMQMPAQPRIEGQPVNRDRWTIPLEYQPVHEMLQALRLPPYDEPTRFTLTDALKKYWYAIILGLVVFALLGIITMLVIRLNAELKKSNQRLAQQHTLILDSVADGIYGVDLDGNSTFVNKSMERITGWKARELIGKNQHAILHHTRADGSAHPADQCPVYQTFRDDKTRFIEDDVFWRSDGSDFPVEYSCTPLKDENDGTIGSVVIFRDISERKKAEQEARKYRSELAHMARVSTMGEMASGMAHELNQPLTAISTYADACIRLTEAADCDKDRLTDTLEIISAQAKRAGAIIHQLRNFIRKEMPERNPVDLNISVREVLILIRQSLDENDIELGLELASEIPPVLAQRIQIDQVILNLVKNAIEAMAQDQPAHKKLTISTDMHAAGVVRVSIADTASGIDQSIRDRLFTPFATSKKSGMGLGLSISQGIISEHGGKLTLAQSSTSGSTFQFTLPVS